MPGSGLGRYAADAPQTALGGTPLGPYATRGSGSGRRPSRWGRFRLRPTYGLLAASLQARLGSAPPGTGSQYLQVWR